MVCAGRSPSCESAGPLLTQAFAWCNDPPVGRRFIPGFRCKRPRRAGNCCAPAPGWEFVDEPAKTAPHDVIPPRCHWLLAKPETSVAIVGRNSLRHLHRALPEPSCPLQRRSSTGWPGWAGKTPRSSSGRGSNAATEQVTGPKERSESQQGLRPLVLCWLPAKFKHSLGAPWLGVRVQAWSFLFHSW
jgi:hypothetical protein